MIMRNYHTTRAASLLLALLFIAGCKAAPTPAPTTATNTAPKVSYGGLATPPPPPTPFKVFHHDASSITLVTSPSAKDDQIKNLMWQLHAASINREFDQMGIPQKLVDARDPIIWFHIYRGPKCASEKYTTGKLPCGPSYHAAGDYTLGSFSNKNRDDAVLFHADDKQTELWNPDTAH